MMQANKFSIVILILQQILSIRTQNATEVKECIPGVAYSQGCNRCWCVSDGNILVCDKMDCKAIPRKMYAKVKLKAVSEKDRSVALVAGALTVWAVVPENIKNEIKHHALEGAKYVMLKGGKYVLSKVAPTVLSSVQHVVEVAYRVIKKTAKVIAKVADRAWSRFKRVFWRIFG